MKKMVCGWLVGCLLLCLITQGFGQALQRRRAQAAARAAAAEKKANPKPDTDIKGFWITRSAPPAHDHTVMTLEEPQIESTGAISIPKFEKPGPSAAPVYAWDAPQPAFRRIEISTARLLIGRKLDRGERAFVRVPVPDVEFKGRDGTPKPIGKDRVMLGN